MNFLILSFMITMLLLVLSFFIDLKMKFMLNKNSMFECGFDSMSLTRNPFSLQFFKLCLIFIFFDIEIIIILPSPMIIWFNPLFFWFFLLITTIIFISLLFEWNQNSLNWLF